MKGGEFHLFRCELSFTVMTAMQRFSGKVRSWFLTLVTRGNNISPTGQVLWENSEYLALIAQLV